VGRRAEQKRTLATPEIAIFRLGMKEALLVMRTSLLQMHKMIVR
jgi:hypothetical protein